MKGGKEVPGGHCEEPRVNRIHVEVIRTKQFFSVENPKNKLASFCSCFQTLNEKLTGTFICLSQARVISSFETLSLTLQ